MIKKSLFLFMILLAVISCKKENEFEYPLIQTGDVTDIDSAGVTFHARISDLSQDEVLEYGFVWQISENPEIENSERIVFRNPPASGVIQKRISTTLKAGETYYARAFIRNHDYITYGKEVSFLSLGSEAPLIHDFSPKFANILDTVMITGEGFSYRRTINRVSFGSYFGQVVQASQDTLFVLVPGLLTTPTSIVKVSILGNVSQADESFELIPPVIEDFAPKTSAFGSEITILGNNFLSSPSSLKVSFDFHAAEIVEIQNTTLKVLVPEALDQTECIVSVKMNNIKASATEVFTLDSFTLDDFEPKTANTGDLILLSGFNFSSIPENNVVSIGGIQAEVVEASFAELQVRVPMQDSAFFPTRDVNICVEIGDRTHCYNETLLINDKWFRLSDSPVSGEFYSSPDYILAHCFTAGDKAFIGLNNNADFWEYDPSLDSWTKLADFPGQPRIYAAGFVIGNKIYFGTGAGDNGEDLKDMWEYDITTDNWLQLADFAGSKRTGAVAFEHKNKGYLGTGFLWFSDYRQDFTDIWEYNANTDGWLKISDFPIFENFGTWWGVAVANSAGACIGLGNLRVAGGYDEWIYQYSPASNTWQRMANFPHADVNNKAMGFTLDDIVYVNTRYTDNFYKYDNGTDSWIEVATDIRYEFNYGITFSMGDKAYVGLGFDKQMWEYDPKR